MSRGQNSHAAQKAKLAVRGQGFWADFKNKTDTEADPLIALGYDSLKIIEAGLKGYGENNECIKDYLLNLKEYPSARGKLTFDKDGDLTGIEFKTEILKEQVAQLVVVDIV